MWRLLATKLGRLLRRPTGRLRLSGRADWEASLSILFDREWYLARYPDIRESHTDPLRHYLQVGGFEGRDPNPLFDSDWYLEKNADVRKAGVNPLIHYLRNGWREGRDPSPLFDSNWYLTKCPELASSGQDPLIYYFANSKGEQDLRAIRWSLEQAKKPPADAARKAPAGVDVVYFGSTRDRTLLEQITQAWRTTIIEGLPHAGREDGAGGVPGSQYEVLLAAAMAGAAASGRHLLFMLSRVALTVDDIDRLVAAFDVDPMIGFVAPRLTNRQSGEILPLQISAADGAMATYDRSVLDHLPEFAIAPEFLPACVIVRSSLVANLPQFPSCFNTLPGALRAMLTWSRRAGYRMTIANRVVVPLDGVDARVELAPHDRATLGRFFPDGHEADSRFASLSLHRKEALLGRAYADCARARARVLLDCSGMRPLHNGTSECILGILDGLAALKPAWDIDIYLAEDASEFHQLRERYPAFRIVTVATPGVYTAAVRLSQPWVLQDVATLHRAALFASFLILDTISWDTIYTARTEVEQTWEFAAQYADGLLFISEFTKARFNFRFPVLQRVHQAVTHLSFNFDEYRLGTRTAARGAGNILVVGNDHDHKAINQALSVLPVAFPTQDFVVLGSREAGHPNVKSIKSGFMSRNDMEHLYADARLIVYPSFYEGFGLPIVKGLSYGLDVVARRSDLLREVADNCAAGGRLVPFDDPASLLAAVRNCLDDDPVEVLPLGAALGNGRAPIGWRQVAARVAGAVNAVAAKPASALHDDREAALKVAGLAGHQAAKGGTG